MNEAIHNMHKKQDELVQLERESNKMDNDLQVTRVLERWKFLHSYSIENVSFLEDF